MMDSWRKIKVLGNAKHIQLEVKKKQPASYCQYSIMYHRQQNKRYPKAVTLSEKLQSMKCDRCNKFDFCYYGQVNSPRLESSVASK